MMKKSNKNYTDLDSYEFAEIRRYPYPVSVSAMRIRYPVHATRVFYHAIFDSQHVYKLYNVFILIFIHLSYQHADASISFLFSFLLDCPTTCYLFLPFCLECTWWRES